MTNPVWIECQETGCPNGIGVWHKHAENMRDSFWCASHDGLEPRGATPAAQIRGGTETSAVCFASLPSKSLGREASS